MSNNLSKSKIDKAGRALANPPVDLTFELLELEEIFDNYRAQHLEPLTRFTSAVQTWLSEYGERYYVAQRLKRKPQIARKLKRLSVRLTQLQDIGGLRIIVNDNKSVDALERHIEQQMQSREAYKIKATTDYRVKGRDRTGYRALHKIIEVDGVFLELQVRSRIQHYWAENIERTSVIYGQHLKEEQGDPSVINYFKRLSDIFYEVEMGRDPSTEQKIGLEGVRLRAEDLISQATSGRKLNSFVDEGVIKTLASAEGGGEKSLSNWLLVFNWNTATFVSWDRVDRDPIKAVAKYAEYEKQYTTNEGYEVVLIGSSDIATVQETHSHYFGISPPDSVLENLTDSLTGISNKMDLSVGARKILSAMYRKKFWSSKSTSPQTLKNHFCKDVGDFDESLNSLLQKGFVVRRELGGISLDIKLRSNIEAYI